MPGNTPVKDTARVCLKKIWPAAIAASVIIGATAVFGFCISSAASGVWTQTVATVTAVLYFIFITAPLIMGLIFWLWRVTVLNDSPVTEMFYPFSSWMVYMRVMRFIFLLAIRLIIMFVVVMLPYALAHIASSPELYSHLNGTMPVWTVNIWVFAEFLKYAGIAAFFISALRYYLAPVLFVAGSEITSAEALHMSRMVSKVSMGSFIQLVLGFAGWAILSVLLIPALYTLPFFLVSFILHCRYAINYYNGRLIKESYSYGPYGRDLGGTS